MNSPIENTDPVLAGWRAPPRPSRVTLDGRYCRIEPIDASRHGAALHEAYAADTAGALWTWLSYGPFPDAGTYGAWLAGKQSADDPLFFAFVDRGSGRPNGAGALMRIDAPNGSIEVGNLAYAPALQRTAAATEAMYLLMRHVFELGYRRYEWKCDARNLPSRRAAERLGFRYEGTFLQHMVYKGRSRDTAWYSIVDGEWSRVRAGFEAWLDATNFDAGGRQRRTLGQCRDAARARS